MSVRKLQWFVALTLVAVLVPEIKAEPHCPGNVSSLTLRLVEGSQVVVPVTINHNGPYDFLVDTGAQITTVDPDLAGELHLKTLGMAGVIGVGVYAHVPMTQLGSVAAGSHEVANLPAVIQNLGQIKWADHRVRGILGGDFLEHFDVLVDYARQVVCLDDSGRMRTGVKGEHIPLASRPLSRQGSGAATKLILPVRVQGLGKRRLLLQLDSGSNVPLLFEAVGGMGYLEVLGTRMRSRGTDGKDHSFTRLAAQDIRVGPHEVRRVLFMVPIGADTSTVRADADGVLPTALFQRVYVNYEEGYVVLEPW